MRCAILQPSYIPWRGYFDIVRKVDLFVFYDDVQYDKHGWRNRNRVKTAAGPKWLTVPVFKQGAVSEGIPIHDIEIRWDPDWSESHRGVLRESYRKSPHFDRYFPIFAEALAARPRRLVDLTIPLTERLAAELGIRNTRFRRSSEFVLGGRKTDRLLDLLSQLGATHYLSGPSARDYLDEAAFTAAGIGLEYMEYSYPEYPQLHPPFEPAVSILDLLFMTGDDAPRYIWGVP
jgi:hypothetical protein